MYRKYIKRLLDIILSLIFIIVLSPLFLITSLLIIKEMGFPLIYKQQREGKNKIPFTIYKFRIMDWNEKAKREDRMTKITSLMDRYRLNELPQLFNVLKGDMSLIGPRPFIYEEKLPKMPSKERYLLKPGMTGLAQISGGRGITHEKKLEYDLIYNEKISFLLDLKIMILTPIRILKYK